MAPARPHRRSLAQEVLMPAVDKGDQALMMPETEQVGGFGYCAPRVSQCPLDQRLLIVSHLFLDRKLFPSACNDFPIFSAAGTKRINHNPSIRDQSIRR